MALNGCSLGALLSNIGYQRVGVMSPSVVPFSFVLRIVRQISMEWMNMTVFPRLRPISPPTGHLGGDASHKQSRGKSNVKLAAPTLRRGNAQAYAGRRKTNTKLICREVGYNHATCIDTSLQDK